MKLTVYSYSLPLKRGGTREGLLLYSNSLDKWAEASPLPGRSRERLSEVIDQLKAFHPPLLPSLQFAIEHLTQTPSPFPITLSSWGFIPSITDLQIALRRADNYAALGFSHLKIKLQPNFEPIKKVIDFLSLLNLQFHLRIDCNRAFSLDKAAFIFSQLYRNDPSNNRNLWIEEPTYELSSLPQFPYPFALDETIEESPDLDLKSFPQLKMVVLKPTILGGEKGSTLPIQKAGEHSCSVVFSGAYESGVGTLQIASLAQKFPHLTQGQLGIGTYSELKKDVFTTPLPIDVPKITLDTLPSIDHSLLKRIADVDFPVF